MGVDEGVRAGEVIVAEDEVDNVSLALVKVAHRHAAHTLDRQVRSAGRDASAGGRQSYPRSRHTRPRRDEQRNAYDHHTCLLLSRARVALHPGPHAVVFRPVGDGSAVLFSPGVEILVCWRAQLGQWTVPRSGLHLGQGS